MFREANSFPRAVTFDEQIMSKDVSRIQVNSLTKERFVALNFIFGIN